MPDMIGPHEALVRGFMMDGEEEDYAHRLARTALGSLVAANYVLKVRDGDIVTEGISANDTNDRFFEPLHIQSENN
jgi:hypothetical protein